MNCCVDIVSGRIAVRASLSDLMIVSRLGGKFDPDMGAWMFPATAKQASVLRAKLPAMRTTDDFNRLLDPAGVTQAQDSISGEVPIRKTTPGCESDAAASDRTLAAAAAQEAVVPAGLLTQPWRHQVAAFRFAMAKFTAGFHGILMALVMGGGKSLVFCMIMLALGARRTLIACPLRVVQVWVTQFERHVGVPLVVVPLDDESGSVEKKTAIATEKLKFAEATGKPFVAVINYESAWRDPFAQWAERKSWDLFGLDEIHRIKRADGKASNWAKRMRLRANYRVGMTGTPMPHSPMDLYGIFRALDTRIFGGSFSAFRMEYAEMGGYERKQIVGFKNLPKLERLMGQVTFRVGSEVLDLPPATHVTYSCALCPEARRIYDDLYNDFVAQVNEGTITAANAMVKLLRLQQIVGGSVPTDDKIPQRVDSSKQKLLADTLEDIGPDEPVVVFCRFHADLDAVHEACAQARFTSLELSGRRDELKRWQDGEAQVLAVQISAGGVGVDLTRARFSAYYSLSFSLGEYDQALARVHRPGQTRPVEHIHLVAKDTVDVKIMRALEKRAEVVQAILAEIKSA